MMRKIYFIPQLYDTVIQILSETHEFAEAKMTLTEQLHTEQRNKQDFSTYSSGKNIQLYNE